LLRTEHKAMAKTCDSLTGQLLIGGLFPAGTNLLEENMNISSTRLIHK